MWSAQLCLLGSRVTEILLSLLKTNWPTESKEGEEEESTRTHETCKEKKEKGREGVVGGGFKPHPGHLEQDEVYVKSGVLLTNPIGREGAN